MSLPVIRLPEKGPWPIALVVAIVAVAGLVTFKDYALRLHWTSGTFELAPAQINTGDSAEKPK